MYWIEYQTVPTWIVTSYTDDPLPLCTDEKKQYSIGVDDFKIQLRGKGLVMVYVGIVLNVVKGGCGLCGYSLNYMVKG